MLCILEQWELPFQGLQPSTTMRSQASCHCMSFPSPRKAMGEVIAYQNNPPYEMYCQLKLASGERIMISIGDSGIRIWKLAFAGRIRTGTIWKCERDEVRDAFRLFADPEKPMTSTLDAIRDKLIDFQTIADVKAFFRQIPNQRIQ